MSNVLDKDFATTTPAETALFDEQKKFMFAVFEHTLQTDKGRALVCKHEADYDAQKIYAALVDHYVNSTKASLDAGDILSYITSAHLADGKWNGTTHGFILHWQDQVHLYDKQTSTTPFTDDLKKVMLQNAVYPIEEL